MSKKNKDIEVRIEEVKKQIKGTNRNRKNKLITSFNPNWDELYDRLL